MKSRIYPKDAVIMAPLSSYTDLPFRDSCRRFGAKYMFTQMIDVGALVWGMRRNRALAEKNLKILQRAQHEEWLGVQMVGSDSKFIEEATRILNDYDFQLLDLNMGCPMKKVTSRGCGAHMYKDMDNACRCLETMVKVSRLPVTAKTRIIDKVDIDKNVDWARKLESCGISALTVHGRVKEVIYSGEVAFDSLRAMNEELDIQLIANGGVMNAVDAIELKKKTGCDSLMVARGAVGNPWIFLQLQPQFMAVIAECLQEAELQGDKKLIPILTPKPKNLCREIHANCLAMADFHGETLAMRLSRKLLVGYLKKRGYSSELRSRSTKIVTLEDLESLLAEIEVSEISEFYRNQSTFYEDFIFDKGLKLTSSYKNYQ